VKVFLQSMLTSMLADAVPVGKLLSQSQIGRGGRLLWSLWSAVVVRVQFCIDSIRPCASQCEALN